MKWKKVPEWLVERWDEVVPRDPLQPEAGAVVSAITDFSDYPLPGRTLLLTARWSPPERQP